MIHRAYSITLRVVIVMLLTGLMLMGAVSAYADSVISLTELRVQLFMFNNQPLLIVSGTIPESTPLPATVNLAVPEGALVEWAGEIAGGEVANDPKADYELLETKDGWDIYSLTAKKYHVVQIEAQLSKPFQTMTGNDGSVNFTYVPATDADELKIGIETPANITDFEQKPGYEVFGSGGDGGMVYGPQLANTKAGEQYSAAFGFTTMADSGGGPSTSGDSTTAIIVVLVILAVVVIGALLVIINRQKSAAVTAAQTKTYKDSPQRKAVPQKRKTTSQAKRVEVSKGKAKASGGFRWNSPQMLIIIIIVVVGIALLFWASQRNATNIVENNGVFSQVFAVGDPCATVEFNLKPELLDNPKKAAQDIFQAIRSSSLYVLDASMDSNRGLLVIQYCGSSESEQNIVQFIESTGYVEGAKKRALNVPLALDNGAVVYFLTSTAPCVVNTFTFASPDGDAVGWVQKLAGAVKGIPSITGVGYDPATKTATFGFCEESTTDASIAEALEKAGIEATLEKEHAAPTAGNILM
jgi:copper chaperone CopZ